MADNKLYQIGITQGDVNGIGYEVIMKALAEPKMAEICTSIIYGLAKVATYHRKMLDLPDFSFQFIKNLEQANLKKANLINLADNEVKIDWGIATEISSKMAILSLTEACKDLKNNKINALVTAPVNKHNIQSEDFKFISHIEFLAHAFESKEVMKLMVSDALKVGFVTDCISLTKAVNMLSKDLILNKLSILNKTLITDFGYTNPNIAVLSFNPYAGENELLDNENINKVKPAIEQAFAQQINAFGPFSSVSFFKSRAYTKFDAVLALYYEQGMLPFKLLSNGEGVHFTAGLPIVHTAPEHGTAYDIAGKDQASGQSMRNALYLAVDILNRRTNPAGE
ncbi:MAG: 4-hydroxythreonine-4-phosphate dehydrogenase PdxA [Bacteroidales bacterium]|jgi:4-hydroxythreonine-4-phosphate dehydrogenase|nr:4-hydroxythreonine-4-phosphate dehydrogenase PdxA [Bacteroidales bacterium]